MNGFVLVVQTQGAAPQQLEFDVGRVVIGREAGDIIIGDPQSSSTHAELQFSGGRLIYRDLNSTNGSFINGQRISQVELAPGTVVQIGDSSIRFVGLTPDSARGRTVVKAGARRSTPVATPRAAAPAPNPMRTVLIAVGALTAVLAGALGFVVLKATAKNVSASVSVEGSSGGSSRSLLNLGHSSPEGGEVVVKAVWFSGTPGVKVAGGTSDITIRVTPNTKDGASVGVIEEFAGGTGNQWRTATWLAAFNASRATGLSLIDHEYLVRAGGHIDGPSAGMLTTSTMMALLKGQKLLPNTTMTGTINPDGSAGPVGGIVQKMGGAKNSGIKRFGYPMGARNHVDLSDKSVVDLNEVGANLGLEVREIHDMYEAYEFMTGDTIKRPEPVGETELELNADTSGRLRAKLTLWKSRLEGEVAALKDQLRKNPAMGRQLDPQLGEINKLIDAAGRFERSDLPVAALVAYAQAGVSATIMRDTMTFMERFMSNDLQGVFSQIDQATAVAGQVKAFADEVVIRAKKTTVGGHVNATVAFRAFVAAQNFADLGEQAKEVAGRIIEGLKSGKVQLNNETRAALAQNLLEPIIYYHGAEVMLNYARDFQDLAAEEGQASTVSLAKLGREAGAYGSAAGASLSYFDALVTEEAAKENGVTKAQAQNFFANKELSYLLAVKGVQLTENLKATDADGTRNLLRLAAGIDAYLKSAALVNKYYSLSAQEQKGGEVVIQHRKSLTAQLEQARLHAREMAADAKATAGFIPVGAKLDYQVAGAMREGTDAQKLEALEYYWSSAFWSELASKLARQ